MASGNRIAVVTSSCTTGTGIEDSVVEETETDTDVVDEDAATEVVVDDVLVEVVVIVGSTGKVDDVVVVDSAATVVVVSVPTAKENIAELAKLYESPVHVPPNGLSRPYAYMV